jgi:hypothetical protein
MAGTQRGGKAAAKKNIEKYGSDFYAKIGAQGGKKGRTGGFASNKVGEDGLTGRQRAAMAGAAGGRISRRTKSVDVVPVTIANKELNQDGLELAA